MFDKTLCVVGNSDIPI